MRVARPEQLKTRNFINYQAQHDAKRMECRRVALRFNRLFMNGGDEHIYSSWVTSAVGVII